MGIKVRQSGTWTGDGPLVDADIPSTIARDTEVASAVATHEADTTSVHGITDTSTLYRAGGTDVAIADGGTGASTATAARANLGGPRTIATARATRTSGSITLNSATWADLDTGLDLTLDGAENIAAGDILRVGMSGFHSATGSPNNYLDAATVVAGSPVSYIGSDGGATRRGVVAWEGEGSTATPFGGTVEKALVSGDISGGNVTLRLRYRQSSASARDLFATADIPLHWWAEVFRPS